jgi:hypothetical protein
MRTSLRIILVFQLALGLQLYSSAVSAKTFERAYINQAMANLGFGLVVPALNQAKNIDDLISLLPPWISKVDRDYVRKTLAGVKTIPKFERLNRGVAFTYGGKRHTVVLADIRDMSMKIDKKVSFTYQTKNALRIQMEVLGRSLEKSESASSWLPSLMPEANAFIDGGIITGVVVGFVVTLVCATFRDVIVTALTPWGCAGREPGAGYFTDKFCTPYFEWLKKNQKTPLLAVPLPDTETPTLFNSNISGGCQSKDDPRVFLSIQDRVRKATSNVTITLDAGGTPTSAEYSFIQPNKPEQKLTFGIENTDVVTIFNKDGVRVASRRPGDLTGLDPSGVIKNNLIFTENEQAIANVRFALFACANPVADGDDANKAADLAMSKKIDVPALVPVAPVNSPAAEPVN